MNIRHFIFAAIMIIFTTSLAQASQNRPISMKFGADYFWSQSSNYYIKRINPITETLNPSITPGSLRSTHWAGHVAVELVRPLSSTWTLNPELSFLQLGNFSKNFNPFIEGPYESTDIINTFHSTMKGNIIAAILNIDYLINNKFSMYAAPGLGFANIKTTSTLNYQTAEDATYFLITSKDRHSSFSPQFSIGIMYAMTTNVFFDLGLQYIWLGNISFGTFSRDSDNYTATKVAADHVYLLGPKLNISFLF
ncbi:outer membrane beta-barrel protein [Legionella nagasakiensis]|uniref:outer membrane beta-barrel protein n=1 Tax=Legionella nagasakiensis TaxID=535290 RepID=UPI001055F7D8|nr:outer membrane beta-barrel protein [Legionella nagasakiensis]